MPGYRHKIPSPNGNQRADIQNTVTKIASELLQKGASAGIAVATGLKRAQEAITVKRALHKKSRLIPGNRNSQPVQSSSASQTC